MNAHAIGKKNQKSPCICVDGRVRKRHAFQKSFTFTKYQSGFNLVVFFPKYFKFCAFCNIMTFQLLLKYHYHKNANIYQNYNENCVELKVLGISNDSMYSLNYQFINYSLQ